MERISSVAIADEETGPTRASQVPITQDVQ
jgi:hypothetical protein